MSKYDFFVISSIAIFLSCCQPAVPLAKENLPASKPVSEIPVDTENGSIPTQPTIPISPPRITQTDINGISFIGVSFDSRTHKLEVIDQPNGPGSDYSSSRDVSTKKKALFAINAGFFTPEGKPLGLVISNGITSGSWNSTSSLGSGIYLNSPTPTIIRRSSRSTIGKPSQLLQAGPLLIENSKAIQGLNNQKSALRSLILTDGNTRWWIGKTSSCTLYDLSQALSRSSPASWIPKIALNLDGGRSTDLFISQNIPGGPIEDRTFLNRPVRNFLILVPR